MQNHIRPLASDEDFAKWQLEKLKQVKKMAHSDMTAEVSAAIEKVADNLFKRIWFKLPQSHKDAFGTRISDAIADANHYLSDALSDLFYGVECRLEAQQDYEEAPDRKEQRAHEHAECTYYAGR